MWLLAVRLALLLLLMGLSVAGVASFAGLVVMVGVGLLVPLLAGLSVMTEVSLLMLAPLLGVLVRVLTVLSENMQPCQAGNTALSCFGTRKKWTCAI